MKDFLKPSNLLNIRLLFILVLCSFYACKKDSSAIDQNCSCTKSNTFRDNISTYIYNGEILGFGSLFTVLGSNKLYFTKGTDSFDYPLYELKNGVDSLLQDSCWYRPTINRFGWLAYTRNNNQKYIRKSTKGSDLQLTFNGINKLHSWSNSGKLLVRTTEGDQGTIWTIYDTLGAVVKQIDDRIMWHAKWHPKKDIIRFVNRDIDGTMNVKNYDPNNELEEVIFEDVSSSELFWTKEDEFITYESVDDHIYEVYIYNLTSKTKKLFFNNCHERHLTGWAYNKSLDKYYGIMNYTQKVDKVAYSSDSIVEIFNGKVIRTLYP